MASTSPLKWGDQIIECGGEKSGLVLHKLPSVTLRSSGRICTSYSSTIIHHLQQIQQIPFHPITSRLFPFLPVHRCHEDRQKYNPIIWTRHRLT